MEASAEFSYEIEHRPEPREKGRIMFHTNFVRPADMDTIQNRTRFTCSIPAKEFMDDGGDPKIQEIYYFMTQSKVDEYDAYRVIQKLIDFVVDVTFSVEYRPHYGLTVWLTFYVVPCSLETYLDDLSLEETFEASLGEYGNNSGTKPATKLVVKTLKKLRTRRYHRKRKTNSKADHCTICLKEFRKRHRVMELPCRHKFDRKCMLKWLKYNHVCPLCRHELCEGDEHLPKVHRSNRNEVPCEGDEHIPKVHSSSRNEVPYEGDEDKPKVDRSTRKISKSNHHMIECQLGQVTY